MLVNAIVRAIKGIFHLVRKQKLKGQFHEMDIKAKIAIVLHLAVHSVACV
jgi:hypothetical protein